MDVPASAGAVNVTRQAGYGPWLERTNVARPALTVLDADGDALEVDPWMRTSPLPPPEQLAGSRLAVTTVLLSPVTRRPF